ncbi:MAG: hypothetical protein JSS93_02785 [Bacteroidetes bacterium]|nr:hypothetical protein [Bacteroidota bacterium]
MSRLRVGFYFLFALYQVGTLVFTIFMESKKDDLNFLFTTFNYISYFKYGALVGVLFLIFDFFWTRAESKKKPGL